MSGSPHPSFANANATFPRGKVFNELVLSKIEAQYERRKLMEENMVLETGIEAEEALAPADEVEETPAPEEENPLAAHVAEMRERFPHVDILRLEQNSAFRRFAGSRYGKESLAQLYEDYSGLVAEAEKGAEVKAEAKRSRLTGGSSGGRGGALSSSQREALRRWNDSNPDMKMTEKEFLERR